MLLNSFNHLSIVSSKQSLNKRIVQVERSQSVFTCHSLNIVFQTIFCVFSISCSWADLLRATGYSPKYMKHLLPLDWTSFVLKTTCECSSKLKRHYCSKKTLQKQSCFGWRDLILPRPFRENSRFQSHIWLLLPNPIQPKCPRPYNTVSQGVHLCFWG